MFVYRIAILCSTEQDREKAQDILETGLVASMDAQHMVAHALNILARQVPRSVDSQPCLRTWPSRTPRHPLRDHAAYQRFFAKV
jgi:hypothetical protein